MQYKIIFGKDKFRTVKLEVLNFKMRPIRSLKQRSTDERDMRTCDQKNELISTIQLNHDRFNVQATVIWIPAHQGIEGNEKAQQHEKSEHLHLLTNTNTFQFSYIFARVHIALGLIPGVLVIRWLLVVNSTLSKHTWKWKDSSINGTYVRLGEKDSGMKLDKVERERSGVHEFTERVLEIYIDSLIARQANNSMYIQGVSDLNGQIWPKLSSGYPVHDPIFCISGRTRYMIRQKYALTLNVAIAQCLKYVERSSKHDLGSDKTKDL
ncbi:hypothetical protein WN51_14624 [Melipona quadrifasciata]|uniref:RNase H type-1 domain-containing protein n=1 Tax=Melipona quadrifasciata TaxID=166423 RepID=A0A0M8ZXU4_9HYME|nr:hypothetical protein WN51_14624 [Melipona quadrifasciata]